MSKDEAKKVLELFMQLQKIDSNALNNLQKFVNMAKTNPAKYQLALKFL